MIIPLKSIRNVSVARRPFRDTLPRKGLTNPASDNSITGRKFGNERIPRIALRDKRVKYWMVLFPVKQRFSAARRGELQYSLFLLHG